jgi:NADH-quinone oxidoreductase subunit E
VPDPATTPVPAEVRAEIEAHMAKYPDLRSAAIPALKVVQRRYGWCSPSGIEQAACVMRLTPAYLVAVATFYDMFETVPRGENTIYVCTNISCSLRGADRIYEAMLSAAGDDPAFNVRAFECLGACDIAPMASVNGEYVGPLSDEDCGTIVEDCKAGRPVLEHKQLRFRRAAGMEGGGEEPSRDGDR